MRTPLAAIGTAWYPRPGSPAGCRAVPTCGASSSHACPLYVPQRSCAAAASALRLEQPSDHSGCAQCAHIHAASPCHHSESACRLDKPHRAGARPGPEHQAHRGPLRGGQGARVDEPHLHRLPRCAPNLDCGILLVVEWCTLSSACTHCTSCQRSGATLCARSRFACGSTTHALPPALASAARARACRACMALRPAPCAPRDEHSATAPLPLPPPPAPVRACSALRGVCGAQGVRDVQGPY